MSMDHLLRRLAPISDRGWTLIDSEAKERLSVPLGARRVVDFDGPHGWRYSATSLGSTEGAADSPVAGVTGLRRAVLPLAEVRTEFAVPREALLDYDRGAVDTDLTSLDNAVARIARLENTAVFHGWSAMGITGITEATPHPEVPRVEDFEDYPSRVADAVEILLRSGVQGPYALAVGPADYTAIVEAADDGNPLVKHVRMILAGPVIWAPGVHGGVVVSLRGGDFLFESGQDIAVGYDRHDDDNVHLYLQESFSFRVATPEAAIALARREH